MQVLVDITLALIAGILGYYLWLSKKSAVNASKIEKLESGIDRRLDECNQRLIKIESCAPSREDVKRIHRRIDDLSKEVSSLSGEFRASKGTLDLIQQFLLNQGK